MGQIAHLRNQFNSMNTFAQSFDHMYIYIIKLAQKLWRRRFLNFVNIFLKFCYYLLLEKGVAIQYRQT